MFGILVEATSRPGRRWGTAAVSVAVHAAVILAGVWAAADPVAPSPGPIDREDLGPAVFTQPRTLAAPPETGTRSSGTLAVPRVPMVPAMPAGPRIDIPHGLPPVEMSLGNPFTATPPPGSRIGVRPDRHGGAGVPGEVLDHEAADKPALPLESNRLPAYPEALRSAAIEGAVEIEFVIEASGRVRDGSVVVLRSDHRQFAESVRVALADFRFLPAEVGGQPVAVRVRQRFAFTLR